MKWIRKETPPADFEQWKEDFKVTHGRPPLYNDFKGPQKQNFKLALLAEQGHICCYCMARISKDESHIEHFIARAESRRDPHSILAADNQLGYKNLFLSCDGEYRNGRWDWKHCGRVKDSEGTAMLISPADPAVSSSFSYDATGIIRGITPEAMTTIRVLNLQDQALVQHRRTAIYFALSRGDELEDLLDEYQEKDADGMYAPFCEAILYVLRSF